MNAGAIIGFIMAGVVMGVGVLIWANIEDAIACPANATNPEGFDACNNVKDTVWTVLSIAPFTLFFGLIAIGERRFVLASGKVRSSKVAVAIKERTIKPLHSKEAGPG